MIRYSIDINQINKFLSFFNTEIKEIDVFDKYLIYYFNEIAIGFLAFSFIYDRIEINYIFVEELYRRKNIATKMLIELEEFYKLNKCSNITLEVNEINNKAIVFYKKHGFKEVSVRSKYYGEHNGILMMKEM
ncbi:MAG: GNAT family N-acetyltransferase [Bacilli bacterium]